MFGFLHTPMQRVAAGSVIPGLLSLTVAVGAYELKPATQHTITQQIPGKTHVKVVKVPTKFHKTSPSTASTGASAGASPTSIQPVREVSHTTKIIKEPGKTKIVKVKVTPKPSPTPSEGLEKLLLGGVGGLVSDVLPSQQPS